MMNRKALAALLVVLSPVASAATWHITNAAAGNDSNACTESTTPCKTLAGVLAKPALVAGDKILIAEGTYSNTSSCQIYIKKAVEIYGGYDETFTFRSSDPADTVLTDTRTGGAVCRLFAISSGHAAYTLFDGVKLSGVVDASSHAGTVLTYDDSGGGSYAGAWVKFNNVIISGNTTSTAGAIYSTITRDRIELTNTTVSTNVARTGNGAGIHMAAATSLLTINDSIIDTNAANGGLGGGIYLAAGVLSRLQNVTLYKNTAATSGGDIYATGADTSVHCVHCSVVGNTANESIRAIDPAKLYFKNSLLVNASSGYTVRVTNSGQFTSGGYNRWGINNNSKFNGMTAPTTNNDAVNTQAAITDLLQSDIAMNGGTLKSIKPAIASPLIDAIPHGVAGLQVGVTPGNPFTSIAQASGAIAFYEAYEAGYYYFEISSKAFRTYVDDEGFVLVATNSGATSPAAFSQDSVLTLQSDEILSADILAVLDVDQVKITAPDSKLGDLDMRTYDATTITRLKANQTLPNNFDLGKKVWWGTHEANMSNATCTDWGHASPVLSNNIIGHCGDGTQGLHWQGARGYETVTWATATPGDDMNLWVKSSAGNCDGSVTSDQRGLPRPDFVNPNDPNQYGDLRDCDIGSFEWNEGYRLDCADEDGMRPEWNILAPKAGFCISDINDITPKALLDSLGSFPGFWLLVLGLTGLVRVRSNLRQQDKV
jgi:hypothetical protein